MSRSFWTRLTGHRFVPAIVAMLSVVTAFPILLAQQPAERPVFKSRADIVPLDVIVLDRNRHPVRGLTAADFHVVADGENRPIMIFDAIEMPDRVRGGAPWLEDVTPDVTSNGFNPDRIVVLLLDDWNTSPKSEGAVAVRKIGQAVIDELRPSDLVGIVYPFQTQRGVDFTTDRSKLRDAIERFTVGTPSQNRQESGACPRQSCVFGSMRAIANAARLWPDRRKLLVYISPEFPPTVELNDSVRDDVVPDVTNAVRELQRANVTVYQFDPRGLEELLPGITASMKNAPDTRSSLAGAVRIGMFADQTGGSTFTGSNEPWTLVPQMFVENDSYYILGFTASTRVSRSGFHPIRVTVNRPGMTVVARRDYYAGPEAKDLLASSSGSSKSPRSALDRAMFGIVPAADLPLSITAAPFRVAGARTAAVAIVGGFDRPAGGASDETVDVAVRAFDEKSQLRESRGLWTSTLRLQPQQSSSGTVHYDAVARLDLRPGSYEVRLSMKRAANGVTGGVARFLTVPDFEKRRVSVSGVVLGRPVTPPPTSDDPMRAVLPLAPTTVRAFAGDELVTALVRVYQGGQSTLRPASLTARIFNETDEQVFDATSDLTPEKFVGSTRAAEYQLRLPLATLPSGEYVLKMEVTVDKSTVPASPVRFRVRQSM